MSEQRFENIERRLNSIEGKVDELRVEMHVLHDSLRDELRVEIRDQGRQMRVLHEEVLDRIAALAPDFTPIRREFTAADSKLREDVDRRLVPLEALARSRRRRKPN